MASETRRTPPRVVTSERGAILIQVAVAMIVLIAFLSFVADYGLLWVARRQAQNAADAGALAGAVAIAFDADDRSATGPAKTSAYNFAIRNLVAGEAPDVVDPAVAATDIKFYDEEPSAFPSECADNTCLRVDVYRNQERNNALPVWFGELVGVSDQGVRATAIARVSVSNATDCLKPWAVVDKWVEYHPAPAAWSQTSKFDKYITQGPQRGQIDPTISPPDLYVAPNTSSPGTGFHPYHADGSFTDDYGRQLTLKVGGNNEFDFGSGWFMALALGGTGGATYKDNIKGCVGIVYAVGDEVALSNEPGEKVGPTNQGVATDADSLVNKDPGAYWDPSMNGGRGGIAGSAFAVSPRIVAIPLINPDVLAEAQAGGRTTVTIANIAGFFVEGLTASNPKGVVGRLVNMPGMLTVGTAPIGTQSGWLVNISLIR